MARIPWWLWAAVGAGMYLLADRIGENMKAFTYVGLFFLIVGIFKMLVSFIVGSKGRKAARETAEYRPSQVVCPRCRGAVYTSFFFCPRCGTRLRH